MLSGTSDSPWTTRIANADKAFKEWESKFKCQRLYDYYENFQWKGRTDSPQLNYQPYTLNLFHSTIKIKLANFLFQRPSFVVSPEPGHSHWNLDFAVQSAQIKQDFLNTVAKNRNVRFAQTLKRCALDSFFRFGMVEVGYAADWRNPLKDDPQLKSWEDDDISEEKDRIVRDDEVPVNERFYVKRIKPNRFRTGVCDAEDLDQQEWVGYYQFYYVNTLKKTKGIKWPDGLDGSYTSTDYSSIGSYAQDPDSRLFLPFRGPAICKVWHIWDLVAKKRRMILSDNDHSEIWSQQFDRLPLIDIRWDLRENGFLPIPPSWYWLSSQDEINESREQIRSYRRRFTRKFQALKGMVDEEEVEKFVAGPDGVVITVKQLDAIKAIDNPEIGPTSENALNQAKDDFNIVSGTSAEARGQDTDRETATQAKLVQNRAEIRENAEQLDFTNFVCEVGREILVQAKEKLVEGMWVKMTSGPSDQPLQDMQPALPIYKWVSNQDLSDGNDFTIDVDAQNATPAAMQKELTAFTGFVTFLAQNPMLSMSPLLIRETAYRFGYKNEQVIHQMQQVAILAMAAKAAQGQQGAQGAGPSSPQQTLQSQQQTPDLQTIGTQLTNQLQ